MLNPDGSYRYMDAADAAKAFRETLEYWSHPDRGAQRWAFGTLRGKNLACWCPEGQPCHADVLLEVANS